MATQKKKNPFYSNRYEIYYNLLNSLIAGTLTFLGALAQSLTTGFTFQSFTVAVAMGAIASFIVAATKFKDYWDGEKREYQTHVFNFV